MAIVDLEAETIRIRDLRSRIYFSDALKCFRAGALRAAITSTWVALTYDLIQKYRELDVLGDAEARLFITEWDAAVRGNDTKKLLQLERSLLDHCHTKLALIDTSGLRTLKRLFEDRHTSAHPAFVNDEELYEPSDEQVRTHMAAAVELILAQKPVQGRGIFNAFSNDVQSPGFPNASAQALDYVELKYLNNMRENVVRNFGTVLAKSLIRNVPPEWSAHRKKILNSLEAVKLRRPERWNEIAIEVVRLINADEPLARLQAVEVLAAFPELVVRIDAPTITALQNSLTDGAAVANAPAVFAATEIAGFREFLVRAFESLANQDAASVLSATAPIALWPNALRRYSESGSFRGAEARFEQFIAPFKPLVQETHLSAIFEAVEDNDQISHAALTPRQLEDLLRSTAARASDDATDSLYRSLGRHRRDAYRGIWDLQEQRGWRRPAPAVPAADLDDDDI